MSAKLLLQYATSKLSEQEAVQILARSGLQFTVGTTRAHYNATGALINEKGQPVSAPVGQVTGVILPNDAGLEELSKIKVAKAPEPVGRRVPETFTPVSEQKVGGALPDGQLHTQSAVGGASTTTVVRDPRNPAITHTVAPGHAAYDEAAQKHAAITGGAIPNAHEVVAAQEHDPKTVEHDPKTVEHDSKGVEVRQAGQPGGPAATPGA